MHIHSISPAHAHGKHASSVDASQRSASTAVETTQASGLGTENPSAPAKAAGKPERPESEGKLTPAGLLAAQLRFQSMNSEGMNKGQARAQEVINRNIERYRANHGITTPPPVTDTTPGTGATAGTAPATGTEQPAASGTISIPQPTAGSEPTTVSAGSTPATPATPATTPHLGADTTPSTGATAGTAPAAGTEQSVASGTISAPQPIAVSEPTTVSADTMPAATQTTAAA